MFDRIAQSKFDHRPNSSHFFVNASPIRLRQQSNGLTNERKHRYLQYSLEFIFEFLAVVSPNAGARISQIPTESEPRTVSNVLAQELIEAGVHFGHRSSRWNPKMRPYIFGRKNLIHIIDVRETIRGLLRGKKYLKQVAATGSWFYSLEQSDKDKKPLHVRPIAAECPTSVTAGLVAH